MRKIDNAMPGEIHIQTVDVIHREIRSKVADLLCPLAPAAYSSIAMLDHMDRCKDKAFEVLDFLHAWSHDRIKP